MIRTLLFLAFWFSGLGFSETKISDLPIVSGSAVSSSDYFPYVDVNNSRTARLLISGIATVPSFISALSSVYSPVAGSTSITTLGTITTGVWNGNSIAYSKLALTGAILNADLAGSISYSKLSLTGAILNTDLAGSIAYSKLSLSGSILSSDISGSISAAKGGTGQTSYTTGDLLYASGSSAVSKLGIGSTGQILKVSGGIPSWGSAGSGLSQLSRTHANTGYTILSTDDQINVDSSGGVVSMTLPAASSTGGKVYYFKVVTGGSLVTVNRAGSDTIDGLASYTMATTGDELIISSDGSASWNVLHFGIACGASYKVASPVTIPNNTSTVINFGTKLWDPLSLVSTGSSWVYTAKYPGKYQVNSNVGTQSVFWTAGVQATLIFVQNSTSIYQFNFVTWATVHQVLMTNGSGIMNLAAGDTIQIQMNQNSGTTAGSDTDVNATVSIERISN